MVENYSAQATRLGADLLLLSNSVHGKPVKNQTSSVCKPIVKANYIRLFSIFALMGADSEAYGDTYTGGFTSDVTGHGHRPSA